MVSPSALNRHGSTASHHGGCSGRSSRLRASRFASQSRRGCLPRRNGRNISATIAPGRRRRLRPPSPRLPRGISSGCNRLPPGGSQGRRRAASEPGTTHGGRLGMASPSRPDSWPRPTAASRSGPWPLAPRRREGGESPRCCWWGLPWRAGGWPGATLRCGRSCCRGCTAGGGWAAGQPGSFFSRPPCQAGSCWASGSGS